MMARSAKTKAKARKKTSKKVAAKKASRSTTLKVARKARSKSASKARKSSASSAPAGVATARKPRARTKPLSKELNPFRDLLLQKQEELTEAYNISKGDSRSKLDDGTEDYIDYAASSYAREFLLSLTELDRKQLMLVEDALRRVNTGEYGRCSQCGKIISRKRLQVSPWAQYCLHCQELEDQGLLPEQGVLQDEDESDHEASIIAVDTDSEDDGDEEKHAKEAAAGGDEDEGELESEEEEEG